MEQMSNVYPVTAKELNERHPNATTTRASPPPPLPSFLLLFLAYLPIYLPMSWSDVPRPQGAERERDREREKECVCARNEKDDAALSRSRNPRQIYFYFCKQDVPNFLQR